MTDQSPPGLTHHRAHLQEAQKAEHVAEATHVAQRHTHSARGPACACVRLGDHDYDYDYYY